MATVDTETGALHGSAFKFFALVERALNYSFVRIEFGNGRKRHPHKYS
jgi:hypothetical protein